MPDQSLHGGMLLGPPFDAAQRERLRFEATARRESTGDALVLQAGAWGYPDILLEHSFRLVGASTVQIQTAVFNNSGEDRRFQCVSHVGGWELRDPKIAVPWATGLVVDRAPGFPDWREDELESPAALAEPWVAFETEEASLGCFWESASRIEIGRGPAITSLDVSAPAGHSVVFPPVYATATLGDWTDVRDRWRDLIHPEAPADLGAELHALEVTAGDGGVLTPGELREFKVVSRYTRQLPMSLEVHAPDGWDVSAFGGTSEAVLEREKPQFVQLAVRRTAGPILAPLRIDLAAGSMRRQFTAPLFDPGHGDVCVEQGEMSGQPVWSMTNSSYRITLAPSFGGAIHLDYRDENQLLSAFPEPRAFSWTRPWFGGLSPYIFLRGLERWEGFPDPGRLPHERWEIDPITELGAGGTLWTGLSMRCEVRSPGMVGLTVRLDYLAPPAAPLLALRLRVENVSEALLEGSAGVYAFLQPGGRLRARLAFDQDERWDIERGPSSSAHGSGRWAAVHDREAGVAVALVSPKPYETNAMDERDEGMHLASSLHRLELEPGASQENLSWLVLGESLQEVEAGKLLSETVTLP